MYAIVLLIVVATLSLAITRIASVMLTGTGMASESARFQARSALSGVGFTTTEAERVVTHPVRRRIIMALMLIGNAGLVTAIAALLGGFLGVGGQEQALRALLLVVALLAVYGGSRSAWVDRRRWQRLRRVEPSRTAYGQSDSGAYAPSSVPSGLVTSTRSARACSIR